MPARADDGLEIVVSRLPVERGTDALACRDDLRGIARAAAGELDLEITPDTRLTVSSTSSTEKPRP